ncbi:SAM-dependent methyltransferase [Nocardiopsis ganjiahuensis]|uniref:SAM-dependent methyltransferase n=1 Tax=Nocardiopsis ganjiahuensis TaxID=239984 RepID=UPI0003482D20|nr:SAM-dependent methyltransferase [Nocardiopsis ganjiahuensis]
MASDSTPTDRAHSVTVDTSVPHSARIWNYWLGGKDNYPVDREVGEQILRVAPVVGEIARVSRAFLVRAVSHLAGEAGVRQFLDVGTGLPTSNNTHEVAQSLAPESRIVYVDNDPLVLAHARALLVGAPEGFTTYLDADLREPENILRAAADTLDFEQPIALMLMGSVEHVTDDEEAYSVVSRLVDALPSGSYLVFNDATNVVHPEEMAKLEQLWNSEGSAAIAQRTPEGIAHFFKGLELLEPGVVSTPLWRPDSTDIGEPRAVDAFCGVGRKP